MEENKMTWSDITRIFALILLFTGIIIALLWKMNRLQEELDAYKNAPADTVTVVRHDTIKVDSPVPVHHYIKEKDTAFIVLTDVKKDTVKELVFLPREYMVYKDSTYRAVVSGVQPRLDSIEIYRPTITNTITKTVVQKKKTRWGIGLQAGYGFDGKKLRPYVGAGVQYNLISW